MAATQGTPSLERGQVVWRRRRARWASRALGDTITIEGGNEQGRIILTRREWLLEWLDDYVVNLRILSQRHVGADRIEDRPDLLFLDWRMVEWYDALWLFELEGIKASRYPDVLENGAAEYATPRKFARIASGVMFNAPHRNRTPWSIWWRRLPDSAIELDPRYVAFRTIHDWIVLSARVLAERANCLEDRENQSCEDGPLKERVDPFTQLIRTENEDGEPFGMLCGNLRERLVGGRSHLWDSSFIAPDWQAVERPWAAIQYLHCRGLLLTMQLQYGALRRADDPRLAKLELLRPKVFAAYVADVLAAGDEELSRAWRSRSAEDVQNDPRFIAHKCGFDTQIILHIAREAMKGRDQLESDDPSRLRAIQSGSALYDYLLEVGLDPLGSQEGDTKPNPH